MSSKIFKSNPTDNIYGKPRRNHSANREKRLTDKPIAAEAVSFGFQGGKKEKGKSVYVVEEQIKTEVKDTWLSVSITKTANVVSHTHAELRKKYRIEKYNLHPGHVFPESVQSLMLVTLQPFFLNTASFYD